MRSRLTGTLQGVLLCLGVLCLLGPARASGDSPGTVLFAIQGPDGHVVHEEGYFTTEHEAQEAIRILNEAYQGEGQYDLYPLTLHVEHGRSVLFQAEPGTSLWLLITFVAVFILLYWKAWPVILAGLQAREEGIREAVQSAERTRAEARALLEQYEQQLAGARDQVQSIIDEGKRDATKVKDDIVRQGWKDVEEIKERARREMELEAARVTKDIYDDMAGLATSIASRIIERELNEQEHERLILDAIEKYGASAGQS